MKKKLLLYSVFVCFAFGLVAMHGMEVDAPPRPGMWPDEMQMHPYDLWLWGKKYGSFSRKCTDQTEKWPNGTLGDILVFSWKPEAMFLYEAEQCAKAVIQLRQTNNWSKSLEEGDCCALKTALRNTSPARPEKEAFLAALYRHARMIFSQKVDVFFPKERKNLRNDQWFLYSEFKNFIQGMHSNPTKCLNVLQAFAQASPEQRLDLIETDIRVVRNRGDLTRFFMVITLACYCLDGISSYFQ